MSRPSPSLLVFLSLTAAAGIGLAPRSATALISPSGVDWSERHVVALLSDDIGSAEYYYSATASTRYGLDIPWNGTQWENVAEAIRGHVDGLGIQFPLTLYTVCAFAEPDFTLLSSDSSTDFWEDFDGEIPSWEVLGSNPPELSTLRYMSAPTSAHFETDLPTQDGYARRYVLECNEYEFYFWLNLDWVGERTNIVEVTGSMGRSMSIEARDTDSLLYLREGFFSDHVLTPIGPFALDTWMRIRVRMMQGVVTVDLWDDGSNELSKKAAMLPTFTNVVKVGDTSTTLFSGGGFVDNLIFVRYLNEYPAAPLITPLGAKFPQVVTTINANRDIFIPQSHGWTHCNDIEVQRRYALGEVDDRAEPEESWWREFYNVVADSAWDIPYQKARFNSAFALLNILFGSYPTVHVSGGNVFGSNTDTALLSSGGHYHEALASGGGMTSPYDPGIFWSSRTASAELFYRQPDPNPELSAIHAMDRVDSLFSVGAPAIVNTHAFNALVGTDGIPLAVFYNAFLDSLISRYPDVVALTNYETAQLEETGHSVGKMRSNKIYVRNYLPEQYEFRVPVAQEYAVLSVVRLNTGAHYPFLMDGPDLVFSAPEGDYRVNLIQIVPTTVPPAEAERKSVVSLRVYPVPANPHLTVEAQVSAGDFVRLGVFNTAGRRVRDLWRAPCPDGRLRVDWDGVDDGGNIVASGLYFARLESSGGVTRAKFLLVR